VLIDGVPVYLDRQGMARLTPGRHQLEVTGYGFVPWARTVSITSEQALEVAPVLELTKTSRRLRRVGWGTLGAAVVLGLTAAVLGWMENSTFEEIRDYDRRGGSRGELNDLVSRRRSLGLASTVLFGFAGAVAGTGVVIFIIAPEAPKPYSGPTGAVLNAKVAF